MFEKLQSPLALAARVLMALLFVPAGFSKIAGFAGTAGYIASVGLPFPQLAMRPTKKVLQKYCRENSSRQISESPGTRFSF